MSNGAGHCALFRRKRDLADGLMGAEDEAARAGLAFDGRRLNAGRRAPFREGPRQRIERERET
jgi:hypothetical protein